MPEVTNGPSKSSLQAILLVTRTHAGPRILLRYPPAPGQHQHHGSANEVYTEGSTKLHGDSKDSRRGSAVNKQEIENSFQDYNGSSSHLSGTNVPSSRTTSRRPSTALTTTSTRTSATAPPIESIPRPSTAAPSSSPEFALDGQALTILSTEAQQSWTQTLGLPTDSLARMLAPTGRSTWHKRSFELQLGDSLFVGCPMYEKEEGGWSGRKRRGERKGGKRDDAMGDGDVAEPVDDEHPRSEGDTDHNDEDLEDDGTLGTDPLKKAQSAPAAIAIATATTIPGVSSSPQAVNDSLPTTSFTTTSSSFPSSGTSGPNSGGIEGLTTTTPDTLHMFNVVFVLSCPASAELLPSNLSSADTLSSRDRGPGESAPPHQKSAREMYSHCVKKLARALQLRQRKSGYVWDEVRKIIGVREKARETGSSYVATWPYLQSASSLARALAVAFNGLGTTSIAHLTLGSGIFLSLQLPQQTVIQQVLTPTAPNRLSSSSAQVKDQDRNDSLWLTTFNSTMLENNPDNSSTNGVISPYSALLLLAPVETLLKELSGAATSPFAAPLSYYIRHHSLPTKSLAQLARKSRLSLTNLQLLASHLTHWRRARAIPPLHHTNTYIVSPVANWHGLREASLEFRKRFPALPALTSILARLSSPTTVVSGNAGVAAGQTMISGYGPGPQPWGRHMPSPDHKEAYMEMLEWLVRDGWVTQLRTFAWVHVSAEVKAYVAKKMRKEAREEENSAIASASLSSAVVEEAVEVEDEATSLAEATSTGSKNIDSPLVGGTGGGSGGGSMSEVFGKRRQSSQGSASLLSPRLKPKINVPLPRRTSEAGSISSVSTALRVPARSGLRLESPAPGGRSTSRNNGHGHRLSDGSFRSSPRISTSDAAAEDSVEIDASQFESSIVPSPHRANALESRWLEHIGQSLDKEVRDLWPRLLNYFDGMHALEEIATQEGMKRKVLSPVMAKLLGHGEGDPGGGGGVLRMVRHW